MTERERSAAPGPEGMATLDNAVGAALERLGEHGAPTPDLALLVGTGVGLLPSRLQAASGVPLAAVDGVPPTWRDHYLHWGRLGELAVWMLEDTADEPLDHATRAAAPTWAPGFPCWLAADAGARSLIVTAAGSALAPEGREALAPGQLAFVSDHLNLSGGTPLVGLGDSRLGPMFPDVSTLHDPLLRARARALAGELGIDAREAVCACTVGPAIDTPAERRFYARAGADVAVQGLAGPLLATAHAGLGALAIVVVTDAGERPVDLVAILGVVQRSAPALEDLLLRLASEPGALRGAGSAR